MADHIVMPPISCCSCPFCVKRRWELELCAALEQELYEAANADLHRARDESEHGPAKDYYHPRPRRAPWERRSNPPTGAPVRYPQFRHFPK